MCACDAERSTPTEAKSRGPDVRALVTGDAAGHLDANGRFVLPSPTPPADIPIISPERARELAVAYLRTWGPSASEIWSGKRGRRIEPSDREVSRVYYADTPHHRIPDGYHPAYQRMIGPWYILQLTAAGEPVVALAVSAYSTDLQIRDGIIREPAEGGEYFTFQTIPADRDGSAALSMSPEETVEYVNSITGARVTRVPELVLRNSAWSQFNAQWKLVLDRPVHVESLPPAGSSAPRTRAAVHELFVGPGHTILIPRPNQETSARMRVLSRGPGKADPMTVSVAGRPGMFVRYDEVHLVLER